MARTVYFSFCVNELTSTLKSFITTGRREGRKEKNWKQGIRSTRINTQKPWKTDLRNPLQQHTNTSFFSSYGLWLKINSPLWRDQSRAISGCEWVEKAELVCQLSRVKNIECVVPMRLLGGMYAVYQQLSEEKRADFACIKDVLYTAFALNPVMAYKQFAACHLRPGEMVDIFLAELHKLVTQFGSRKERGLVCAFITGLPEHVEKLLQATTRVDDLLMSEILACAQAILKDSFTGTGLAAAAAQLLGCQKKETTGPRRCYICQGPNHMAQDCFRQCKSRRPRKFFTCYWCKRQGHIAQNCPGNEQGDESSVPVSSQNLMWMAHCLQSLYRLTD